MSFGKGYIRDPHLAGVRLRPDAKHTLGTFEPPAEAMELADKAPPIWDQNGFSACVGFAWARLWSILLGFIVSPWGVYVLARLVYDPGKALVDEGSMPHSAAQAIETWGVSKMSGWTFRGINEPPQLADLESCEKLQYVTVQKIYTLGAARSLDVRRALSMGLPVVLGIDVDDAFENYKGGTLSIVSGDKGGHYIILLGYKTLEDGRVVFYGHNSWGIYWGIDGAFWADELFLFGASDLYIGKAA